jgi:broad specificity phosphatase PhoE
MAENGSAENHNATTLILVRHGETEGNVQQVWHGAMDAPLTKRGEKQVAAVAARLAEMQSDCPVDVMFVSPLPRAQSTAAAIAAAIDAEAQIDDGLREFSLGDWEGRSFRDLKERENLWGRWDADPTFAPPNGESPRSFNQRVLAALQALAARHPGQTMLIVTHGGVICNVLASWIGDGPDDWRRYDPHNCSISVLRQDNDDWRPLLVNDIRHLPQEVRFDQAPEY